MLARGGRESWERVREDEKISEMKENKQSITRSSPTRERGGTIARWHEGWSSRASIHETMIIREHGGQRARNDDHMTA